MKRVIPLVLVMAMTLLTLSGCADGGKQVELTKENIYDYLEIGTSYGEYKTHTTIGVAFTDVDVYLKVYPVVSATFENVEITAEISCPIGWKVNSSDSAYSKSDVTVMKFTFRLPSDGRFEETHSIGRSSWKAAPNEDCKIKIISVTGTVKK